MYEYLTQGTCCRKISVELEGKIIKDLEFDGGCNGNLKAIKRLVTGHNIDEIIPILRGNLCKNKPTSCADQLTYALEEAFNSAK